MSATLAGTTPEARAGLLRFRSNNFTCGALHGDGWRDPACGKPATWRIEVEDAHAGMISNGYFHPATTFTFVCGDHLAEVQSEPRQVFSTAARHPDDRRSGPATIASIGTPDTAKAFGAELRAIRQSHGLSLQRLEEKSNNRWKGPVIGSWERGDRKPSIDQIRDYLSWYAGWGEYRMVILHPGDVIHRAGQVNGATVRYVLDIAGTRIDCTDHAEALRLAQGIPGARVGYQLVGPVTFEEGSS